MTRMIPSTVDPSVRSGAERKLFTLFRDAPGTEEWVCLHSLGLARHATKRRGEIDFLLLTKKGIFVLEVKGGRVAREGGVWQFTDRYGVAHEKNESPFDQASSAMFALEQDIRRAFQDDRRRSRLLFGFGVMFPDITYDVTGSEADSRQVYDVRARRHPVSQFIDRLANYWRGRDLRPRYSPTEKDIEALVDFLRGDFDLVPTLGVQAEDAAGKFLSLEKEQYAVLDSLEQYATPRILVQGGAGTGKTLLATEAARREARRSNQRVLFLCYNRLLARFLGIRLQAEGSNVAVKSIFSLLNDLIQSSSLAEEFNFRREAVDPATVYRELFPEYALLALLESTVTPFTSLIIDEAQDMMTDNFLDIIDAYLEGGLESGRWWIFCDGNNQAAVFGAFDESALRRLMAFDHHLILPTNRRNTKPIADETAMLTRPKVRTPAHLDGIPVKYSWFDKPREQLSTLAREIKRLLAEDVAPSQITILSPRAADSSCAERLDGSGLIQLTSQNIPQFATGDLSSITFCSVSTFKGLENDFILLTDVEDLDSEWWRSVIYVGMSRARVGLHLILPRALRAVYGERLRSWLGENSAELAEAR